MDELEAAWKEYAEACCCHDAALGRHACELLDRLIPPQRPVHPDTKHPSTAR